MSFKSGFESRESRSLIRQVAVSSKSEVWECWTIVWQMMSVEMARTAVAKYTRCDVRRCLFGGPHDGRYHFGVQISPKPSKMALHVRPAMNGFKTNDVIEDWRHWLLSFACSPSFEVPHITVWTVVHTVLTAISHSNGNGQTSTPRGIQTP